MNFLAHSFLSGEHEQILAGNFAGDFIKGNAYQELPELMGKGVLLHREIDYYTDNHPMVLKSKEVVRGAYRHYAGVVVDMYYDHLFAKNFNTYSPQPLPVYTAEVYAVVQKYVTHFPPNFRRMFTYMAQDNWLLSYREVGGIGRALKGMSRRTKFNSGIEEATSELKKHYSLFEQHFQQFFPELRQHAHRFREQLLSK